MLRAGLWHRGQMRVLTWNENPQPGKEFVFTFPQGPEGLFYGIENFLVQVDLSAVAGNRNFTFHLDNGAERYARWGSAQSEVATAQVEFIAYPGGQPSILINPTRKGQLLAMPMVRVPPGHRISSETAALDVGDQYKGLRILVTEWVYEPPAERSPNIGDGSGRVDTISFEAFNKTMQKLAELLEAQQATP